MARRNAQLAVGLAAAVLACGCEWSASPQSSGPDAPGPDEVVSKFLEAVRTGDDRCAAELLSPLARQRTSELEIVVAPPGSDTAKFRVGNVELRDAGARVHSQWTDLDADGRLHTDEIIWILRHESEGWRIVGMATQVFSDRDLVVLNFEEPEEMLRQQQLAEEELARRERESDESTPELPATPIGQRR